MHSAELNVNDFAFTKGPCENIGFEHARIESLYAALDSAKCWFEVFDTFSPASYIGLPM